MRFGSQTVGEVKGGRYQYAMEHLSCFTGAMLALGAQVLDYRKKDLFNAKRITQTCYYIGCALFGRPLDCERN